MAIIEFVLVLDRRGAVPTKVNVWLDPLGSDSREPGEPIAMETSDELHWRGTASVPDDRVEEAAFLLKISAPCGALWTFSVNHGAVELYAATDAMRHDKELLVGRLMTQPGGG